nr:SH3-like domain-containing protein [Virgibacillus litoralis]
MKESDVSSRLDVVIDNDVKTFYIRGEGAGYDRPWGGKKNQVVHDLKLAKNSKFKVDKTEKIGRNLWYRGILNDQEIWIHHNHLKELDE